MHSCVRSLKYIQLKKIVLVRKGCAFYATLYQEVFFCNPGKGGSLIFFRPVKKVKYINNYKEVFDFIQMRLFLIFQGMWGLECLSDMIL